MANKPRVSVTITADSSGYTAAVNKAKGQLVDFGTASKRVHGAMVSDVQASSGALRLLEGGMTGNIRAAERFMASIKGVGAAMQMIYPAVGLIAIGSVIAKAAVELINFTKKTKEAGTEFRASFQEMQNSARLANDELAKTNINLENQIAKLTGKHENVVAAELIEARIQADNLAISAAHAAKEIKDLLEKGQGTFLNKALSAGGSNELFGNINNFQTLKSQARQDQDDALHGGDKKGAGAASARYDQLIKNERAYLKRQRDFRSGTGDRDGAFSGDQSNNLTAINAALSLNYSQSDRTAGDAQNLTDATALKKVEDAKNLSDKAREAAARLRAAQEKAAHALKQDMDDQLATAKQDHLVSISEETQYWQSALAAVHGGSAAVLALRLEINKRLADLSQEQRRNLRKFQGDRLPESIKPETDATYVRQAAADTKEQVEAQEKAATAAAEQSASYAEAVLSIKEAAGLVSKLDAAQELAAIHAKEYAAQVAAIQGSLAFWQAAPPGAERDKHLDEANRQLGQIGSHNSITSMQDQQNIAGQSPLDAWKTSLDQFVQQSRDTATQVKDIWSSALSSVNEEIVKIISTKHNYNTRVEFGNLGAGMFRSVASAGLQKGEGALMGAFGLGGGKGLGSSQANAMWVRMVGVASGAGSSIGGIASKAASGIGGVLGKIGGFVSGLGFAGGGMPPVGMASLVGENGPELFVPHTAGTVVPAGGFGGGNTHITLGGMDLRGASDPAAFEAIANRVFSKHVPSMISASMQAQRESHARKPSSARS
jgi:hypothetical protein